MSPGEAHGTAFDVSIDAASKLLQAVEPGRWEGVFLRYYANYPDRSFAVPPVKEHVLTIQIGGSTLLGGYIGRRLTHRLAPPGNLMVLAAGEPTEWEWTEPVQQVHLYLAREWLADIASESFGADPAQVELITEAHVDDPLVVQIALALVAEARTPGPISRLYVESLTQTLALHLIRHYVAFPRSMPERTAPLPHGGLRRVRDYIDAHLASALTLGELAAVAGMSRSHFAQSFKQALGQPPHQYVVARRLEAARRMLEAGGHSIAEVAARTGFADQSHLQRLFKRRYGVTPRSYRQQPYSHQFGGEYG